MLIQSATNQQNWRRIIEFGDAAANAQTNEDNKSTIYFYLGAAYQNVENNAKAIESYRKVTSGPNLANARQQITNLSK